MFTSHTDCSKRCPKIRSPVCDTKGVTHPNKCVLDIAICEAAKKGKELGLAKSGSCGSKGMF